MVTHQQAITVIIPGTNYTIFCGVFNDGRWQFFLNPFCADAIIVNLYSSDQLFYGIERDLAQRAVVRDGCPADNASMAKNVLAAQSPFNGRPLLAQTNTAGLIKLLG
jgi:hypothetical protein